MHKRFGMGAVYQDSLPASLMKCPLFNGLSEADRRAVTDLAHVRFLDPGDVLFWEGEACGDVFLVISGTVKLFRRALNHREAIIGFMGEGDPLGMEALFTGDGYAYSAVAMEDIHALGFPAWSLQRHVKSHPQLLGRLLSFVSGQQVNLIDRIEWLTTCSAEQRLAAYLINQYQNGEELECLNIPKRRGDLAIILGMTAETLCRELKKLRERGCVDIKGSEIFMKDISEMQDILTAATTA